MGDELPDDRDHPLSGTKFLLTLFANIGCTIQVVDFSSAPSGLGILPPGQSSLYRCAISKELYSEPKYVKIKNRPLSEFPPGSDQELNSASSDINLIYRFSDIETSPSG
jgi:hypothetical protein